MIGVIQRGAARESIRSNASFNSGMLFVNPIEIEIEIVIKINDECFVLRIAGLHQRQRCLVHPWSAYPHAAAVSDNQSHADGILRA